MESVYAVIDSQTNIVVNMIVWDGQAEWSPPEGHFAIPVEGSSVNSIGDVYNPI